MRWSHPAQLLGTLGLLVVLGGLLAGCGDTPPTVAPTGDSSIQITLKTDPDPARPGPVTLTLTILDSAGQRLPDADTQVAIQGDMPSMGHGGLAGNATSMGDGKWQAKGRFSMGGEWRIVVTVTRNGTELTKREFRVQA
jgi:hypothetical protein